MSNVLDNWLEGIERQSAITRAEIAPIVAARQAACEHDWVEDVRGGRWFDRGGVNEHERHVMVCMKCLKELPIVEESQWDLVNLSDDDQLPI